MNRIPGSATAITPLGVAMESIADAMEQIDQAAPSRDIEMVKIKLDEAMMWARRAVPAENSANR